MKYRTHIEKGYLLILLFVLYNTNFGYIFAQELPVLSPVHTNSFLYNPSVAGGAFNSSGSLFVAHKTSFVGVSGNPVSTVFGGHMPFTRHNIGIGANIFIDRTNVVQTTYSSFAFAYHFSVKRGKSISLGLFTDLYHLGVDMSEVDVAFPEIPDRELLRYNEGELELDFSFGIN